MSRIWDCGYTYIYIYIGSSTWEDNWTKFGCRSAHDAACAMFAGRRRCSANGGQRQMDRGRGRFWCGGRCKRWRCGQIARHWAGLDAHAILCGRDWNLVGLKWNVFKCSFKIDFKRLRLYTSYITPKVYALSICSQKVEMYAEN